MEATVKAAIQLNALNVIVATYCKTLFVRLTAIQATMLIQLALVNLAALIATLVQMLVLVQNALKDFI